VLAACAGAPLGRMRGIGTPLPLAGMVAATAKMPGRCRGNGTRPRIGSSAGVISAEARRAAGGGEGTEAGGGSRAAVKSGGLAVFGLGQARPRSAELGAPPGAALSVDRGAAETRVSEAVAAAALEPSPGAAAAGVATTEATEDVVSAGRASTEAADGLVAAADEGDASGSAARLTVAFWISAGEFDASRAAVASLGSGVARLARAGLAASGATAATGTDALVEATCSSAGSFGRAT
jgi:hypothetical protein